MDLATIIGIIGALGTIFGAMAVGGDIQNFINVPGLMVVLGGTFLTVLIKFTFKNFLSAGSVGMKAFAYTAVTPMELIEEIKEMADVSRKSGLLALEGREIPHKFLEKGVRMMIDGLDGEHLRALMVRESELSVERHVNGARIFRAIGEVGPAMGMVGTLIGLVQMLASMDDPSQIGPAMAIALLTTLYGAMLGTIVAHPIADKLELRIADDELVERLVIDGVMGIQEGTNPRIIEQKLVSYLPEKHREFEESEEE